MDKKAISKKVTSEGRGGLTETDLCLLRDAVNKGTLAEASVAVEKVLQGICPRLGYFRAISFRPSQRLINELL